MAQRTKPLQTGAKRALATGQAENRGRPSGGTDFLLERTGGGFSLPIKKAVGSAGKNWGEYQRLTSFGTARWANVDDLRAAGMLDANSGLIIGRVMGSGNPEAVKAVTEHVLLPMLGRKAEQKPTA